MTPILPTAIVPVRFEPLPKRRLAHLLDGPDRARLVRRLLDHVLQVLLDAGLPVIALAPHDLDVPAGVDHWRDGAPGLNRALSAALRRTGTPAIVVHADLPHLGVDDIDAMASADGDVTIARSRDGGTNALLLRRGIEPSFGPRSALRHAQRARAAGLRTLVIDRPGLAGDVDDVAGLSASSWRPPSSSRRPLP